MRALLVALVGLAIATPAAADDMMFKYDRSKAEVLAPFDGFAHWQLLARCSGLMRARVDFDSGRSRRSEQAEAGSDYFRKAAVERYMADRGADKAKASAVVKVYEDSQKKQFDEAVSKNAATTGRSPANMFMTECSEVAAVLSPPAPPPPRQFAKNDRTGGKVICEDSEPTGSRLARRICRTVAEKEEDEKSGRETTKRIQELGGCRLAHGCQ